MVVFPAFKSPSLNIRNFLGLGLGAKKFNFPEYKELVKSWIFLSFELRKLLPEIQEKY